MTRPNTYAGRALNEQRVLVHTSLQKLRWGDMDMLGHVNNTVYFRYMEQARIEWIYALAGGQGYDDGHGPVIVNASCNFIVPLVYPADVDVRMFIGDPGRTSIGSYYDLMVGEKRCAEGAARMVWTDRATGRPVPLPAHVLALFRPSHG
jgi:acyl-CoA thioester hydrolase